MVGSSVVVNHAGAAPVGGFDGRAGGANGGQRPLLHIDDITSVTVGIDDHAPVEKVLQMAEYCLRQAESSKAFGRPDLALKDYIRTNIILLDTIKKNKGWPSLQRDSRTQFERYQRLLRQVHAAHSEFEAIKAQIKADNARTGVQPTSPRPGVPADGVTQPAENGIVDGHDKVTGLNGSQVVKENGVAASPAPSTPKSKPVVHPKPQKLQGNAVGSVKAQDLVQRFANLRASTANATQDPRIRTRPIVLPEVPEPRNPPGLPPPSAPVTGVIAEMPRIPDAVYNPPRGTISSETAALPSSAPRAMFTRTDSTASLNAARSGKPPYAATESSAPSQTSGLTSAPAKRTKLSIPDGDTISVEDLIQFMRAGARDLSILLIDIRSREEFDQGHIMSQATICLEPEVLSRGHISANQIADSMVLAPATEQLLFEKRHEFDLIVFYDQDSTRIPDNPQTVEERAVSGLFNALSRYDFSDGPGQKPGPRLLRGGLDAWTSLVGSASLQSSSTITTKKYTVTPLAKSFLTPRQKYVTRPIQDPAEAKRWEDTIADAGALSVVRTTEDFLRRFPPISDYKESMVAPATPQFDRPQSPFPHQSSHADSLYSSLPSPPTRPPPAVPRRSYSGLAEADDSSFAMATKPSVMTGGAGRENRTGLQNPGVWCFANSSLQAMFATPGFARELWSGSWKDTYQVPKKADERLENPQLLVKMLADLFRWLNQGTFKSLKAQTLMDYLHHIHSTTADGREKPECEIFGGPSQQDAQEFYSFVLDNIHDETNVRRDRNPPKEEKPFTPKDGSIIRNAIDYWRDHSNTSASIVDKYFRGLEVFISSCHNRGCRQELRLFQPCDVWILNLAGMGDETDLDSLLAGHQTSEYFEDLVCETCNKPGRSRKAKFARLPDRLVFCLNRFQNAGDSSTRLRSSGKLHTKVRFPIRDLDLTRYCAEPDPDMTVTDDRHFAGRMLYDCYAVTVHVGQGINGGHYYSYVQDETSADPTDWFRCNDQNVSRVKIGSAQSRDMTETMYQKGNTSAL
ncbi:a8194dcf-803a-4cd2-9c41-63c436428008 [Thermothielavioides terrestris]|uniref:A8194dcf-803a-4cd2-9c41-63c436428008 n=1 Tax=Thermothielavioides terrestris TaxID=2587410 RepID=A0A3S4EZP9_9PEZI|nr:a8194dcf-803a-4cd2-9c41-63c436428008 [Thermothielavioides terrestris]